MSKLFTWFKPPVTRISRLIARPSFHRSGVCWCHARRSLFSCLALKPKRTYCRALQANNTSTTAPREAKAPASPVFATVCLCAPLRYQTLWCLQALHLRLPLPGSGAQPTHTKESGFANHYSPLPAFEGCWVSRAYPPGQARRIIHVKRWDCWCRVTCSLPIKNRVVPRKQGRRRYGP